eukprot:138374_1
MARAAEEAEEHDDCVTKGLFDDSVIDKLELAVQSDHWWKEYVKHTAEQTATERTKKKDMFDLFVDGTLGAEYVIEQMKIASELSALEKEYDAKIVALQETIASKTTKLGRLKPRGELKLLKRAKRATQKAIGARMLEGKFKASPGAFAHWQDVLLFLITLRAKEEFSIENIGFMVEVHNMELMEDGDAKRTEMKRIFHQYLNEEDPECTLVNQAKTTYERIGASVARGDITAIYTWNDAVFNSRQVIKDTLKRVKGLAGKTPVKDTSESDIKQYELYNLFITRFASELSEEFHCAEPPDGAYSNYYNNLDYPLFFDDSAHYHYGINVGLNHIHSHSHVHSQDESGEYMNGFIVGGMIGSGSILVIVLIFCIGLALGLVICFGYQRRKELKQRKEEEVNWRDQDNV